ncbi:MAG: ThuA domain-containing protein [Chitinophagia bacterium]|jgi:type 1 glutamine amidotransferase
MKKIFFLLFLSLAIQPAIHAGIAKKSKKILVFTRTKGFYHKSIPAGVKALMTMGTEKGFLVDTTSDASRFEYKWLKQFDAIVFLSTTGNMLDDAQQEAFKKYINKGGGFVGIHAAADAEYDWPWYNQLVGGYFLSHPQQQQATLVVQDANNIATQHLPQQWKRFDEWYNYKSIQTDLHVLLTLDESSYTGGKNGAFHPIAWYHDFDGGRAFYTGLGHTDESFAEPFFLQHIWGGISYAMNR